MIVKDLDTLGYLKVVFRSAQRTCHLVITQSSDVGLGVVNVVQETPAEGDPQSNGAAESSVNVVEGACQVCQVGAGIDLW